MKRLWIIALLLGGCGESTPLPCDVDRVLQDSCRLCHDSPAEFGAPMSLVDWEDTQADTPTDDGRLVWQSMQARINDPTMPMPPNGTTTLTASQRQVLEAWFAAGAPARPEDTSCD